MMATVVLKNKKQLSVFQINNGHTYCLDAKVNCDISATLENVYIHRHLKFFPLFDNKIIQCNQTIPCTIFISIGIILF